MMRSIDYLRQREILFTVTKIQKIYGGYIHCRAYFSQDFVSVPFNYTTSESYWAYLLSWNFVKLEAQLCAGTL